MTSPIHRCCVELPATWKIVRLFRSDGVDAIGFWTGKDFMASGSHVSPWGWQEIDPMDSYEASRYVALAIGSTPSNQNEGAESIRDANEE